MKLRILDVLIVAWFALIPLFWHLDLSKGTSGYYDVLTMAPYSFLHLIIFFALIGVAFYRQKYSLLNVLLLTLYYPMIQLTNYPYLTFHDVFLHAGPAKNILVNGNINGLPNSAPKYWPGSFIYHALSANITGFDLISANYLLYFGLSIALALILYSLTKTLRDRGYSWAWLCPILFLALYNNQFFEFNHYARTHLVFVLLFFLFWVLIRFESRTGTLIQILIMAAVVIVHPFQSLYIVLLLLCVVVLNTLIHVSSRSRYVLVGLLSSVAFLGWWLFQAGPSLELAAQFAKAIFAPEFITPLVQTASAPVYSLPVWGLLFREYFRWSLITLLLIGCSCSIWIVLRRRTLVAKSEIVILISSLATSLIFLVVLVAIPGFGVGRFTAFAAFPAAFTTIVCLRYLIGTKKSSVINKRTVVALLLIFALSLSAVTTMLRFEGNHYLGELDHPSELSTLSFVYSESQHPSTITMSVTTSLFYDYYDYQERDNVTRYLTRQELASINSTDSTDVLNLMKKNCEGSNITINGLRDQYELSLLLGNSNTTMAEFESTVLDVEFSRIYSNGYCSVYSRTP